MTGGAARPTVLSVVGPGRSGTTVLAGILGATDGVVTAGEIRWLWRRGVLEERPCGCGRRPADCPVWSTVLADVLGEGACRREGSASSAVREIVRAQLDVSARRNRLRVIRSASGGATTWPALERYRMVTSEICTSLARTSGASVVVDTSKRAQEAAVLAGADSVDHYVLHIVRDPRGVAWSWRRPKPLPVAEGEGVMATRGTLSSVSRWVENCLGAELLRRRVPPERWFSTRYEDFVADPRGTVAEVLALLGVDAAPPFLDAATVELGPNHAVAGNPDRFRTGVVKIVADDEWRRKMPRVDRHVIEALTLPLLAWYGYRVLGDPAGPRRTRGARPSKPRQPVCSAR